MSERSFDALVVGAGIVGAACARELAEAGMRVAVCERNDYSGGGATSAGMGHIAVMDDSDAQFALTSYSQELWIQLAKELPNDAEYLPCGSLWVAADDEEFAEVERKYKFYSERAVSVEILDPHQLREAEPHLRPGLAGALLMPRDSVCYPPCAARYLIEQTVARGGEIFYNSPAMDITDAGIRSADGCVLSARFIVLAAGVETARLVPELAVKPRKGHLLITDRRPGFLRHQLIELGYLKSAHSSTSDSVAFNAQPRLTGQILIGSSRQFGVEDPAAERHMLRRMLNRAVEYMPELAELSAIRTWAGFRAATPDKLPLIGLCPGFRNVYLATGHEGLGISTSLATARLLTDELLERSSAIDRNPYVPDRIYAAHT